MAVQYKLLLVDPVKLRRDRAEAALRFRFDISGAGSLAEAQAALLESTPHAVLLTLRQIDDNGLVYGKALREKLGADVLLVVHGAATNTMTASDRQTLADRHRVDMWLGQKLEPAAIEAVLWNTLDRRHRPRAAATERASLVERARAVRPADVKEFLTRKRSLIGTEPVREGEDASWLQLLNTELTAETMKQLLTKPITRARD